MDRDFEWGYREAELGDIGSQIEVGSDESGWQSLGCVAVLPKGMNHRFVCRSPYNPNIPQYWQQSRVRYRLPYAERQAKCGIGVGDFVKVLRVPLEHEDGWGTHAVSSMAASVGKVFEVSKVLPDTGFFLKDDWWYPYFVLEKVEKPALPKGSTVGDLADGEVICTDDGEWIQVLTVETNDSILFDRQSYATNEFHRGWISADQLRSGNRPARLLPTPTISSHGKEAFHVSNPSERFVIKLIFSDGDLRAVVWSDNTYRVFMLADLRVIPD